MGRCTSTGSDSDCLYSVSLDFGSEKKAQRLADLADRKAALESAISDLDSEVTALKSAVLSASATMTAAISTYNASEKSDSDLKALSDAAAAYRGKQDELRQATTKRGRYKVELSDVDRTIARLNDIIVTDSRNIWCVDHTPNRTGELATIEIEGDPTTIMVSPGALLATDADGELLHQAVMSPEQSFGNLAILPGWQKFMPTYRLGTITAVDTGADTADVDLDAATSTQQGLDINQASSLSDVPVEYMTCNAAAFDVDDRVVVQFEGQDWSSPKVIGFESNPVPCYAKRIFAYIEHHDYDNTHIPGAGLGSGDVYDVASGDSPITEDTVYPSPGQTVITTNYPGPGSEPPYYGIRLPLTVSRSALRVRFDAAFYQDSAVSEEFALASGGFTVQTHGDQYRMDVVGTEDVVQKNGPWSFREKINDLATSGDEASGTITEDIYNMRTDGPDPVTQDRDHAHAWIAARWSLPPSTIYVDFSGEWVEYVLEYVGPRPDVFEDWDEELEVPPLAPENDLGKASAVLTPEQTVGAIYRQVDYDAT